MEEENIFGKEFWIKIIRLVVSGAIAASGFFYFNEANFNVWVNLAFMGVAWAILAFDVLFEAFEAVFKEHEFFNEDLLMIVASLGAFAIRAFGEGSNEFIEGVAVMFLFQIGELFEDIADTKSHKAITDAVGLRATIAHTLIDGSEKDIDPKDLKIGDLVLVRVGEILPADGSIVEGDGFLDCSSLTGESVPMHCKTGEYVNAGTILSQGSIKVKVEKEYSDNTVSKIINLIEEGAESKSKAIRFVDKFAKVYTPIVVGIAVLIAIIPPLFLGISDGGVWKNWIYHGLNVLIISCPCAIVISVPMAYFAGIGLASKNGIIIKGSAVFDQLSRLGYLVTDKTGTLTIGNFTVTEINGPKEKILEYAKAAESRSNHPISNAIKVAVGAEFDEKEAEAYSEIAGHGIACTYKNHNLLVGNSKLLEENGIKYSVCDKAGSAIYVACDGNFVGYLLVSDTIREESKEMVVRLHDKNISICMLTGDKESVASFTSKTLGLDAYYSELLPGDKTDKLREIINSNDKAVAYMGDGINDAASITMADVGFAMGGGGSDLAIDNADVVIMNDNPLKVVTSLDIARKVRIQVILNIAVSLAVKVGILIASLCIASFPMWAAVIADTGLTMVLIIWTMLLLKRKVK